MLCWRPSDTPARHQPRWLILQRRTRVSLHLPIDCSAPNSRHLVLLSSPKFERPHTMQLGVWIGSDGRLSGRRVANDNARRGLVPLLSSELEASTEEPLTSSLGLRLPKRHSDMGASPHRTLPCPRQ